MNAGTGPQRGHSGRRRNNDDDYGGILLPRYSQNLRNQIELLFLVLLVLVLLLTPLISMDTEGDISASSISSTLKRWLFGTEEGDTPQALGPILTPPVVVQQGGEGDWRRLRPNQARGAVDR